MTFSRVIMSTLFLLPLVLLLGGIVWSWLRWARTLQPRTAFSTLSLMGLTVATGAGLLQFSSLLVPGSSDNAHALGVQLSLAGMLLALCGALRASALRWHALACAVTVFAFCFVCLVGG